MCKIAIYNIDLIKPEDENSPLLIYFEGKELNELGKLRFYFEVTDGYNFEANAATPVTSLQTLRLFWKYNRMDFGKFRISIKTNLLPNWGTLTPDEQKELVSYYIYPDTFTQEDIDALFTLEEQKNNWKQLVDISYTIRDIRVQYAKANISFGIAQVDIDDLYNSIANDATNGDLWDAFVRANKTFLIQWIMNTVGTIYENAGFAQKSYYTDERKNLLVNILVNGNY